MMKKGVVNWWVSISIVTGSTAQSIKRQYLSNSEADFEVFRPTGATRCTDGVTLSTDRRKLQPEMEMCNHK